MRGAAADAETIRSLRRALNLTQEELARRSNCDVKTIRKAEKGGQLDLSTLQRLAVALDVCTARIMQSAESLLALEQRNLQTVRAWQDAFNHRDVQGMLDCWCDEGVLHIPGTDHVPGGGTYRGKDDIRRQAEEAFEAYDTEFIPLDSLEWHADGNYVYMRGLARTTCRTTGVKVQSQGMHEFRLEDGLIAEHWIIIDTLSFDRIFRDRGSTEENRPP